MKRGVKISLIAVAVVLIAAVAALGWLFSKAVPIGTGYVAKYLCSSTFISNRNSEIVFEEDVSPVNPLAKIVNYKIGMHSAGIEPDSSRTFAGSSYALATPRDWARFGLLYLQNGVWQGEQILGHGWVKYTTTPTPKAPLGEYGAHIWLNSGSADDPENRRWPSAPRDAFAALGFQEQKVIVIPSRKLVLVRFGATSDRKSWSTDEFIKNILACLPS